MTRSLTMTVLFLLAAVVSLAPAPDSSAESMRGGWTKLRARMTSDNGERGRMDYRQRERRDASIERRVEFKISKATPDTSYDIHINSVFLTSFTTNDMGRAKIKMRTRRVHGDWLAFPADFPSLAAGDLIEIGPTSGVAVEK